VPDLPGHGKSESCDGQQTIEDYTHHLVEWLKSVQLRRAVFVGHSMGSAIALTMAIHHPEYVVGLGLISAGARLKVNTDILSYAADKTTFMKAADLLVSYSFSNSTPSRLIELSSRRMVETRQSVFLGDLLACNCFDVMDSLGSVVQPTLVVCGTEDRMTPLRYAQFLSNSIPHAQLCLVPNAGHMVMLEQPRLVADGLLSFLGAVSFHPGEGF
jgi:pimeloyl-ACP methyl ester carboxylesterase